MVAIAAAKQRTPRLVKALRAEYPQAECALAYSSPLELLLATILSAQCTDVRVNLVTPELFRAYPSAADYASAPAADIERIIQSTGFFRAKTKHIQGCCRRLVADFAGEVPRRLEELVTLPGVGRKTANVVLGTAFGLAEGVVVDTHVTRLSLRLGLTQRKDAVKIEQDLMKLLPRREWIEFSHRLIHHGRRVCAARKPKCDICCLQKWCPRLGVKPL